MRKYSLEGIVTDIDKAFFKLKVADRVEELICKLDDKFRYKVRINEHVGLISYEVASPIGLINIVTKVEEIY